MQQLQCPIWGELAQFGHPASSRELPEPNSLLPESPHLLGKELDEERRSSKGSKVKKQFGKSSPWNMIFVLSRGATAVFATAPANAPDIREFSTFFFSWLSWKKKHWDSGKKKKSIPQGIIFHFCWGIHPRARIWVKVFHLNLQHSEFLVGSWGKIPRIPLARAVFSPLFLFFPHYFSFFSLLFLFFPSTISLFSPVYSLSPPIISLFSPCYFSFFPLLFLFFLPLSPLFFFSPPNYFSFFPLLFLFLFPYYFSFSSLLFRFFLPVISLFSLHYFSFPPLLFLFFLPPPDSGMDRTEFSGREAPKPCSHITPKLLRIKPGTFPPLTGGMRRIFVKLEFLPQLRFIKSAFFSHRQKKKKNPQNPTPWRLWSEDNSRLDVWTFWHFVDERS